MGGPSQRRNVGPSTNVDHETDEPNDDVRHDWLARGETIGRYSVLECLGVGGMGVIYSAWDPKLDRKLAIKVVRDRHGRLGSDRSRSRLMREGQALARLRHPNVITVHDVGTHDGRVFVAMEFVEGQTLHQWLLQGPRPSVGELIDVFLQVGRGLAAAHRAGLIHRDVKPENVMIGNDGRVLVLDFGIAREGLGPDSEVIDDPAAAELELEPGTPEPVFEPAPEPEPETLALLLDPEQTRGLSTDPEPGVPQPIIQDRTPLAPITRHGAVIGTPAYMSPEQHRGQHVDARGDQFSFCVAMWEALHGDKPYGEGSRQKLLARMRVGQIRAARNREVTRRVNAALRRGLAWQPDDRFESMEALLEALNPRGHGAEQRLWHGLAIGAIGGMLIGVLATTVSVTLRERDHREVSSPTPSCAAVGDELASDWNDARAADITRRFETEGSERSRASWVRTREHLDDWTTRWLDARAATCRAHFIEQRDSAAQHDRRGACLSGQRQRFAELIHALETSDPSMLDGAVAAAAELPEPTLCADALHLRELERATPTPSSATARQRVAELGGELERLELRAAFGWRAELEHSRQLAAAAREARHPPLLARALLVLATYLEHAGELAEAEELLLEAATAAAIAVDHDDQVRALSRAARIISERGRPLEALRWLELARAVASTAGASVDLRVELTIADASIARAHGQIERARGLLAELAATLEHDGDPTLKLPLVLHRLANLDAEAGDGREAVRQLRRALVLQEQAHGPHHARVPAIRSDLARVLEQLGESQAALGEYERALALSEQIHGGGRETALIRCRIAAALARIGQCDAAQDTLTPALTDARADAPQSSALATVLETSARVCEFSHPDARARAHEAVELRVRVQGREHADVAVALAIEASSLRANGQATEAMPVIERAREIVRDLPSADPRSIFVSAADGLVLHALGRNDEARPLLLRARSRLPSNDELLTHIDAALASP